MLKLADLEQILRSRSTTARALAEQCLAAARDPLGEGARTYTELFEDTARAEAERSDERRLRDEDLGALEGIPVSVKDLFDLEGRVTRAASRARVDAAPALADAPVIVRLREAGAVILGRTNMTEFAYSGLGLNPHFGTPLNPFDRPARRIPGGSSSGAAVSVTDGLAAIAIGSDTGGSVRIPAALCGLVGWKPTAARISREGVLPLSRSLDSIGPLAADLAACIRVDTVLSGDAPPPERPDLTRVRLAVPTRLKTLDTDAPVRTAFARALERIARQGVVLEEREIPEIEDAPASGLGPLIVGSEAFAWHRQNLARHGLLYDPRVRARLELGAAIHAWQYLEALEGRSLRIAALRPALAGCSGWLMPTVPMIAPRIDELTDDVTYVAVNRLVLRNASIVNLLDGCAVSLPCHRPGEAPVGLTLAGLAHTDAQILALAQALEPVLGAL
ncbi:MAG TPA: amidase [Steroidobacteraceae bacterium]|nr:amidase [Steroidobacteraceae bacterium]